MIKNIFFDMDGTLINMDEDEFIKIHYNLVNRKFEEKGYENASEIAKVIMKGAYIMPQNDGSKLNSELFYEYCKDELNLNRQDIEEPMDELYRTTYQEAKVTASKIDGMDDVLKTLKAKGKRLFLTTNPIFPLIAILGRLHWGELDENNFVYISNYDICHYAKPNSNFYKEIMENYNLKPEETMLIGNSYEDDILPAFDLKLRSYYLTSNKGDKKVDMAGTHEDFRRFANEIKWIYWSHKFKSNRNAGGYRKALSRGKGTSFS